VCPVHKRLADELPPGEIGGCPSRKITLLAPLASIP
jgi:hypothetical protein